MFINNDIITTIWLIINYTESKFWYFQSIFPFRPKRRFILLHFGDINSLIDCHSCRRPILYLIKIEQIILFTNKIKSIRDSFQFNCYFFTINNTTIFNICITTLQI